MGWGPIPPNKKKNKREEKSYEPQSNLTFILSLNKLEIEWQVKLNETADILDNNLKTRSGIKSIRTENSILLSIGDR